MCDTHYRVSMTPDEDVLAGHLQELRRGTIVVACLATLRTPGYGYALLETLAGAGFGVDANTLYPLLRRLEKQGLLVAEWNTDESRPRKFYRTSNRAWPSSPPCAPTGEPSTPRSPTSADAATATTTPPRPRGPTR